MRFGGSSLVLSREERRGAVNFLAESTIISPGKVSDVSPTTVEASHAA